MEKIDLTRSRKIRKEREKCVRLAEHLVREEPIQQRGQLIMFIMHMCVLRFVVMMLKASATQMTKLFSIL